MLKAPQIDKKFLRLPGAADLLAGTRFKEAIDNEMLIRASRISNAVTDKHDHFSNCVATCYSRSLKQT